MKSSEFSVGSIAYFISSKTEQVIPGLVTEKIVRTSRDASKVTYILEVHTGDGTMKSFEVDPEKADLFADTASVREFMLSRAANAIDALITAADERAAFYNIPSVPEPEPSAKQKGRKKGKKQSGTIDDVAIVDLGDGTTAKLRM